MKAIILHSRGQKESPRDSDRVVRLVLGDTDDDTMLLEELSHAMTKAGAYDQELRVYYKHGPTTTPYIRGVLARLGIDTDVRQPEGH